MSKNIIAHNKKTLSKLYNVSYKTLEKWLEPIKEKVGDYSGKMFTPNQVKIIYEHLGEP